jgi:two-component sensor histidine kinase
MNRVAALVARAATASPRSAMPTLRALLILLAAAVSLPLLALATAAIWQANTAARARAEDQLQMQAGVLALAVDREFAAAAAVVRTLAGSAALARGDLDRFRDEMEAAARQWPGGIIGLTGPDGFLRMTTLVPVTTPMPMRIGTNTAARQALATGRTEISNLYQGPVSGLQRVAVAAPAEILAEGAEPARHAVSIVLPYQTFVPILAGKGMPPGWAATLVDRQGIVVARSEAAEVHVARSPMRPFLDAIAQNDDGLLRAERRGGGPVVIAFARAPNSGYVAAASLPEAIFSASLRQALLQLAAWGLLLTLVGVGLAVLLGTRIVAAIRALSAPDRRGSGTPRFREVDEIASRLAEAERWRVLLMAEMNHRVKNTLMTVQALAAQTLKSTQDDPERFPHEFAARLAALARAHDLLTATGWQTTDIGAVIAAGLEPWLTGPVRQIRVSYGMPFQVAPRQAQALIVALHELATNAGKYGALSCPGGWVGLHCALAPDGTAAIDWTETGGPPLVSPPTRRGFGSRLLERALPNDLGPGAMVEVLREPGGLHASIRFAPLVPPGSPTPPEPAEAA